MKKEQKPNPYYKVILPLEHPLTPEEIEVLLKIKTPEDIKSLHIISEYTDDHLLCKDVEINNVELSFMWYDDFGFLKYYKESPTAMKDLVDSIEYSIEQLYD
jgi:hypothetical protein